MPPSPASTAGRPNRSSRSRGPDRVSSRSLTARPRSVLRMSGCSEFAAERASQRAAPWDQRIARLTVGHEFGESRSTPPPSARGRRMSPSGTGVPESLPGQRLGITRSDFRVSVRARRRAACSHWWRAGVGRSAWLSSPRTDQRHVAPEGMVSAGETRLISALVDPDGEPARWLMVRNGAGDGASECDVLAVFAGSVPSVELTDEEIALALRDPVAARAELRNAGLARGGDSRRGRRPTFRSE